MDKFPQLKSLKFPETITVKVDQETKTLYKQVKEGGLDAAEIFRVSGKTGLIKAKEHLGSEEQSA